MNKTVKITKTKIPTIIIADNAPVLPNSKVVTNALGISATIPENIIKDIQNALQLMQKSVNEPDEFDPATSQKTFRISLGDINEGRILAILMGKMESQAPNVKLECYYSARDQVPHALATNELSFAVDPFIPNSKDTNSMKVFSDRFVVAHRANHPVSKLSEMTLDEMLKLKYINISNRKAKFE